VSHAAMDGEVLFWFVVVLTLLLLMLIGVTVWTHPGAARPPQPHELNLPAPRPPPDLLQPVRRPSAVVLAGAAVRTASAGHEPGRAGAPNPELTAIHRPHARGGPPWSPAPTPPSPAGRHAVQPFAYPVGLRSPDPIPPRPARIVQGRTASGGRPGAHRQASRRGAHRAGTSSGRAVGSAGRAGRHRAGVR
jgi:hypothetical protein